MPAGGLILNAWTIDPGDPAGKYIIRIFIETSMLEPLSLTFNRILPDVIFTYHCEAPHPQGGASRQLIIFLDTRCFIPVFTTGLAQQDTGKSRR